MQTVAQQWLVYELKKSATWLGIVAGAGSLPYVVFAAWGGAVADKYPRRAVLLWTQIAAMVLAFVLAGLATNRVVKVEAWMVAVLTGLAGIVNAFNMPAQMAFVVDIVEDRKALGNAVALNSLRFNIARFLGPILAGVTLAKFGAPACFLLNGLSFIAVIWSLLLIKTPPFTPSVREQKFGEGIRFIVGIPSVLRVVSLFAAASLLTLSVTTLFPVLASHYGQGATGYSVIFAVNGIGAALGGLAMATYADRFPRRVPFYAGAALSSVFLLCLAFAPNFYAALVCLFLSGATMIAFAISANTKVQTDAPDHLRGRVMAVYALVANAFAPLGGLEIGFLAERFNVSAAIGTNAALCLLITAAIFVWSQRDRPKRPLYTKNQPMPEQPAS